MAVVRYLCLLTLALAPSFSYAANLYASTYDGTVNLLTFDEKSHALSLTQSLKACGSMPSWLTWDSANRKLYCTDEDFYSSTASISSLSAASDMRLSVDAKATTPSGGVANTLYGGSDGKSYIAIAHYQSSKVSTFALPLKSSSKPLQELTFAMSAPGPNSARQDASHPHEVLTDPTGSFLLAPDLGADLIRIWSISRNTGALTSCPSLKVTPGTGPRHAAFWSPTPRRAKNGAAAPTNLKLFVANELSNIISSFSVTYPSSGCLSFKKMQELSPFPSNAPAPSGTKVGEIHVKGNYLYTTNRADGTFSGNDSVATWKLSSKGVMRFAGLTEAGGTYPRTFAINAAGTFVAVGDQTTANVAIFARDPGTGELGEKVASLRVGDIGHAESEDGLSSVIWAK
ncbi:uncharacterized protein LTR77_001343 [Saxophila tyrrhenica]|uniref:6-phosphogluconolactonase n=1 Tax=Saxophila tyrrhenica TaxID=1690608 RepID=A0AAV9PMJ6_9PEZI|nr:hypothetical protein LTR77_001343 [Saxophila tyrrhenica]